MTHGQSKCSFAALKTEIMSRNLPWGIFFTISINSNIIFKLENKVKIGPPLISLSFQGEALFLYFKNVLFIHSHFLCFKALCKMYLVTIVKISVFPHHAFWMKGIMINWYFYGALIHKFFFSAGRMYAVQRGIKIDSKSKEGKTFLFTFMDQLEQVNSIVHCFISLVY